jgi:hypothetical protein
MFDRALRADRQVTHEHLGARRPQRSGNIGRLEIDDSECIIVRIIGHVRRDPVKDRTGFHNHVRNRLCALKDAAADRLREDGFFQRATDLSPVDVERRNELHIAATIPAD